MREILLLGLLFAPNLSFAGYIQFHINDFQKTDIERLERRIHYFVSKGDMKITIDLKSTGGDLSRLLGLTSFKQGLVYRIEALKEEGLVITTRVGAGSICESACTALFTIGDHRIASSRARFMFHAVQIGKAKNARDKKRFQKMYAERWLRAIHSVDRSLARYLDREGWLISRKRDWTVSAKKLKKRFGDYITYIP